MAVEIPILASTPDIRFCTHPLFHGNPEKYFNLISLVAANKPPELPRIGPNYRGQRPTRPEYAEEDFPCLGAKSMGKISRPSWELL